MEWSLHHDEVVNMATDGNREVDLETGNDSNWGEEGKEGQRRMGEMEREIFLQVELYADEEDDSPEIKRKKRIARAALALWKEKLEVFEERILEGKSEMRSIMNEVYQLVGLYSVFVGVVLTAVATSSRLECGHLWSPVGLSMFAHAMLVVVAVKKFRDIRELKRKTRIYEDFVQTIQVQAFLLKRNGYAGLDFDVIMDLTPFIGPIPIWRYALSLIVPLTIFTAGLVLSLVHILCWS